MSAGAVELQARGVRRAAGGRSILNGVDLDVAAGELVAVVGKSGCGKTSLLRVIAGLDRPTGGAVRLLAAGETAGTPVVRMVFQDSRLLPWRRVIDNVRLGLKDGEQTRRAARDALARVGLAGREADWPAVLSGGEKQRVALARALVSGPGLLLLDEPLGALDALTRLEMQRLIERLWLDTGFTAVLVTHDVQEAVALADRVITLEAGRIASDLRVDLPRPRERSGAAFTALSAAVLDEVLGVAAARPAAAARPLASVR
ncbi:MAG TPA: ATP-binding cassette domain-containing protein [Polyangia bacterium]|nr:ATP-binding cassette domain-containing protein [Polyangia bacterium]